MRFDDAVGNGEPKTGTLADWLRGKKRLEDAAADLVRDAFAGIADADRENTDTCSRCATRVPESALPALVCAGCGTRLDR